MRFFMISTFLFYFASEVTSGRLPERLRSVSRCGSLPPGWRVFRSHGARSSQRTGEFVEQIAPMLGADRDAHERVVDSRGRQFLARKFAVGGRHRMAYEGF